MITTLQRPSKLAWGDFAEAGAAAASPASMVKSMRCSDMATIVELPVFPAREGAWGEYCDYLASGRAEPVSLRKIVAIKAITMATAKTPPALENTAAFNGPPFASFCNHAP